MKQSIKEIDGLLKSVEIEHLAENLLQYKEDERSGVMKLVQKYERKLQKHQDLIDKFKRMNRYERELGLEGYQCIAGIDEVGRGPLAGPVVSAVVILPKDEVILGLDDSKKLSEKKREELYEIILEKAIDYSIGIVDVATIDSINILQATYESMRQALSKLKEQPDGLLVDAVTIPEVTISQLPIIGGDGKSNSIAAASIVAKVTRDRMMKDYDELFPEYKFASNKGYGSTDHVKALKEIGPCPLHRRTFIGGIMNNSK